ncbi:MAG: hypothetical protein WAO74_11205 [Polaribacter sp.]|uniref:hypothetical protein n=1 Tax=Polaribacter sp. TaxID=1920175 RepID=UPI003BAF4E45
MRVFLLILIFVLCSCESEEDINSNIKYFSLKAKVVDEETNELINFIYISYNTCVEYKGEYNLTLCKKGFNGEIEVINNSFDILIPYEELTNKFEFYVSYSPLSSYETGHINKTTIKELLKKDELTIKVNKLTNVNINIKNIGNKNNLDKIEILDFIYKDESNSTFMYASEIINLGNKNETYQYNGQEYNYLVWKGENVEASFSIEVKSNHEVSIKYEVTENGIATIYQTPMVKMKRDILNFVNIEY